VRGRSTGNHTPLTICTHHSGVNKSPLGFSIL
jgi:hypothetical protein